MKKIKIGIVGCGAIGTGVAQFIVKELKDQAQLVSVCDIDREKIKNLIKKVGIAPKIMNLDDLVRGADFVVEAASAQAAINVIEAASVFKKEVMILSVGAFVKDPDLLGKAKAAGINIHVPSGAICGVDGIAALSMGKVKKIRLTTSKPPKALADVEYLIHKKINLNKLTHARVVFKGGVKEAIKYFPKNINVAATLLLASAGKDVEVCIVADPHIKRNIHRIDVDANEAKVMIEVDNIPSESNPKTSTLTILSAQYTLKKIFSWLKIGN
jgi:aspartate dehydrogenase